MNLLRSLALAFSSFSKIPMPQVEWSEQNMRYLMCCFPAIGVAIGLCLAVWCWLAGSAGFGPFLFGAGIALIPLAVTGGFHLDGFCDVVDAQSSHADPARKRKILKDPHIGAFAAMGAAAYLLAYAAFASELSPSWQLAVILGGMHVCSRCLSGIATVSFPTSASKGMLSMFHESAESRHTLIALAAELIVCSVLMALVQPASLVLPWVGILCLALLYPFAKRQFGGMSGDLAGFFLQVAELAMLVALVLVLKAVSL